MSNRTAIVASAVIAGCVSIFSIMSVPATAEPAAEPAAESAAAANDCLAAPKPETPAGAHWYYRLEKGTKRKCWYLSDAGGKLKKTATPKPAAAAGEDAPPASKPMQKTVANARAELRADSPDADPSLAETTWPPLTPTAGAAIQQDNQSAAMQPAPEPAARQGWNIASRWPEANGVARAENQQDANAAVANANPANAPAQPAPALTPDRLAAAATAAPTPAATPVAATQPAVATETAESETFSVRVLLTLLVCVLALAAILGPMIFKYVRPRRREEQPARNQRRPIWDANMSGETVRQDNPRMTSPALYADTLPEPRFLDETTDEIEELLARASKRSAA